MTHFTRPLLYGAAFLVLVPHTAGGADRFAGMDAYVPEAMQKLEVPGLAIAVVKDGEVVLARGYGEGAIHSIPHFYAAFAIGRLRIGP